MFELWRKTGGYFITVFQNDCGIVGCLDRKGWFATFRRYGPALHFTKHNFQATGKCQIQISFLSFIACCQYSTQKNEMMPRV
jgi:hypothetical protein